MSHEAPKPQLGSFLVEWSIDADDVPVDSPQTAAARIWRDTFGRTGANADDACIFVVTGADGVAHTIDLSEYDFDELV